MSWFDRRADGYLEASERGLWGLLRSAERRAVLGALAPLRGLDALDVGCGPGFYARELARAGARVFGIDPSERMLSRFRRLGLPCERTGLLEFSGGRTFDRILIAGAGEFIADARAIVSRLDELLPSGGSAVVLLPARGLMGGAYKAWHELKGCPTYLHDYASALAHAPRLRLEAERPVTPLSRLLVLRKRGAGAPA